LKGRKSLFSDRAGARYRLLEADKNQESRQMKVIVASNAPQGRAVAIPMTLFGVGMAYVFWSRFNNSGLVGWFDALQARGRGSYDETLSFLLSLFAVALATGAASWVLSLFGVFAGATASVPRAKPASLEEMLAAQRRVVLRVGAGLFVAIWVGGLGAYAYYAERTKHEMQATYQPVDVAAPVGAGVPLDFVALRGKVHPLGYLHVHEKNEQDGTFFVPLVAPAARDGAVPVHWFVQLEGSYMPDLPPVVRGHDVGGTLSQTAREAFAREGIIVAPDAILVSYVATDEAGNVVDSRPNDWIYFICGPAVLSLLILVFTFAAWIRLGTGRLKE